MKKTNSVQGQQGGCQWTRRETDGWVSKETCRILYEDVYREARDSPACSWAWEDLVAVVGLWDVPC